MKLSHILIYLFAGTFAARLLMVFQEKGNDWVPILGIIFLTLVITWLLYKMYKDINP